MEEGYPHRHVVLNHVAVALVAVVQIAVLHLPEPIDSLIGAEAERLRHGVRVDGVRRALGEHRLGALSDKHGAVGTEEIDDTARTVNCHHHLIGQQGIHPFTLHKDRIHRLRLHGHHQLGVCLSKLI